jgi:hypothetical protein
VTAGLPVTKSDLDRELGGTLAKLRNDLDRLARVKTYTDQKTAADLVTELGYTLDEATLVKTAAADAGQFIAIYLGQEALPAVKDFRTFWQRLWGLGTGGGG